MTALLSLDDAKRHMNLVYSDPDKDTELQGFIDAAARLIEGRVGLIDGGTFTRTLRGWGVSLLLPHVGSPVTVTAAAAVPSGTVFPVVGVTFDPVTGVATAPTHWPGDVSVTYTVAPRSLVGLEDLVLACKIIVAHLWQTATLEGYGSPGPGSGFLVPYRAEALLARHELHLGFA